MRPDSSQSIERVRSTLEEMYKKIVEANPDAYRQMVAWLNGRTRREER